MNKVVEKKMDCLTPEGVISKISVKFNLPDFEKKNDNVLGK